MLLNWWIQEIEAQSDLKSIFQNCQYQQNLCCWRPHYPEQSRDITRVIQTPKEPLRGALYCPADLSGCSWIGRTNGIMRRIKKEIQLGVDLWPKAKSLWWTCVVVIVQAPVNKAEADTEETLRLGVKAPRGVPTTARMEQQRGRKAGTAGGSSAGWAGGNRSDLPSSTHTCKPLLPEELAVMQMRLRPEPPDGMGTAAGQQRASHWSESDRQPDPMSSNRS